MSTKAAPPAEITSSWLQDTVYGVTRIPNGDPSAPLVEQLITVFDLADTTGRLRFRSALSLVLSATPVSAETYDVLYTLLQMVAYTKPLDAPAVLQKLLRSREFLYLIPEHGATLEALAFQVQGEYEVSDWLVDFLIRRMEEGAGIDTLLAALELFSLKEAAPLETPLLILCRSVPADLDDDSILESCFTALRRAGMKRFFAVFCGESLDALASGGAEGFNLVLRALAQATDAIGGQDPWFHPLRAILATLIGAPVREAIETLAGDPDTAGEILDRTIESINQAAELRGEEIFVTRIATSDYAQTLEEIPVEYLSIVDKGEAKVDLINRVRQGDDSQLGREISFGHEETMRESFAVLVTNGIAASEENDKSPVAD